jgi:nucleotide-binding universal stress UspA family protein
MTKEQRDLLRNYEVEPQLAAATMGIGGVYVPIPAPREILEPVGRAVLDRATAAAKKIGAKRITTVMVGGDPAEAILDQAKREKADMIVMGSRGFGELKGLLLGSTSHKIAAHAGCSVVTVK